MISSGQDWASGTMENPPPPFVREQITPYPAEEMLPPMDLGFRLNPKAIGRTVGYLAGQKGVPLCHLLGRPCSAASEKWRQSHLHVPHSQLAPA